MTRTNISRRLCLYPLVLIITTLTGPLHAQKTAIALSGGVLSTPYDLQSALNGPNSAFIFPWEGRHAGLHPLLGASLIRTVSGNWQLRTGLGLFLTGYAQEKDLMWPSEFTPEGYKALLPDERLVVSHIFLEIPLLARYQFGSKRVSPLLEAGLLTNYYLTTTFNERIEGTTKRSWRRSEDVYPVNVALRLGAGVSYRLSERQSVFLQPVLRYQIGSVEKTSGNPGVAVGLEAGWIRQLVPMK